MHKPITREEGRKRMAWNSERGVLRSAASRFISGLDATLPRTRWADSLMCALRMYRAHRRLPRRAGDPAATFNDFIYQRMAADDWTPLERRAIDKEHAKSIARELCPEVRVSATHRVFHVEKEEGRAAAVAYLAAASGRPEVAKPTHGSGTVLFLSKKPPLRGIESFCTRAAQSYHAASRESQYKGLDRKIIVEEDLSQGAEAPIDYKFFCAHGDVLFCQVDVGRFSDHRRLLVTPDFDPIDVRFTHDLPQVTPPQPANAGNLLAVARALSRPFGFVRIDLYSVAGAVYFGEFTFAPEGGTGSLSDEAFGQWVLSRIHAGPSEEKVT